MHISWRSPFWILLFEKFHISDVCLSGGQNILVCKKSRSSRQVLPSSSVSLKNFRTLFGGRQSTERPQVCTIDLSGYDNLWNIGRGKGRNCRRETKIFRQANSRSIWTVQSFIFNIDVESYLALSVTNLKASFVHHYSPKHTISQKFSFFHNLWQKKAKC